VDAIILAGTDLALIFDEANITFPHVDCARVHLAEILSRSRAFSFSKSCFSRCTCSSCFPVWRSCRPAESARK
jgi:hypothetical protein